MSRHLHWFRNDLRRRDNPALCAAARGADQLELLYVLDEALLAGPRVGAPRVHFLVDSLERLDADLRERGQHLRVLVGRPEEILPRHASRLGVSRVTWNGDSAPYARTRDERVAKALESAGLAVEVHPERVCIPSRSLRTGSGEAYKVFTPFSRVWWEALEKEAPEPLRAPALPDPVPVEVPPPIPTADELGHPRPEGLELPPGGEEAGQRRLARFVESGLARYAEDRDRPDLDGTSRLSPYLRFGLVSPRHCVSAALEMMHAEPGAAKSARTWIDELAWREFYIALLDAHPRVLRQSFRAEFDQAAWREDPEAFEAWTEGRTGYPFVDAGMRQLRATGWMHNRVRMVVASFLTKHLGIHWRHGERHFEHWLVDAEPASNNGGWQWAASTGTDAQPWFRVFNPVLQSKRFDPEGAYIRRFVPELAELEGDAIHEPWKSPLLARDYPAPMVDHGEARDAAIARLEAVAKPGPG